jgi:hypothetical protein
MPPMTSNDDGLPRHPSSPVRQPLVLEGQNAVPLRGPYRSNPENARKMKTAPPFGTAIATHLNREVSDLISIPS